MGATYFLTEAEPVRRALAEDPLNSEAAAGLTRILEPAPAGDPELDALRAVCLVLSGGGPSGEECEPPAPPRIDRALQESLVIHPRRGSRGITSSPRCWGGCCTCWKATR